MDKIYKKPLGIAIFAILLASSFTYIGGSFNSKGLVQEADAQGLQLIVSAAQNPAFQNHFFGPQIVSAINNDPGATRPDSTTVGETVKGTTLNRVHLKDGLWYSFVSSQKEFLQLADVLTDGASDLCIFVTPISGDPQPGTGAALSTVVGGAQTFKIYSSTTGATGCTAPTPTPTSPIRMLVSSGGNTFVMFNKAILMPTLPDPFRNSGVGTQPSDGFNPDVNFTASRTVTGADWPYIQLLNIQETDQIPIRAGSASVTLTFAPLKATILAKVDRTTDWPVNAEVILSVTDFMWNINPTEDDVVSFVLNNNTGVPTNVIYQPQRNFLNTVANGGTGLQLAGKTTDLLPILFKPNLQFDTRQKLKLDTEGIKTTKFMEFFNPTTNVLSRFSETFTASNAHLVADTATPPCVVSCLVFTSAIGQPLSPVISLIESNPNTNFFESIDERRGSRADVFAGANDRVASFNYFEIVNSTPYTTHDGFTSVDKEVYQSADRAVFTVTDADQNLRSRVAEEPNGRDSLSFVKIGNPFPLANNDQISTIFGKLTLPGTTGVGTAPGTFNPDDIQEAMFTLAVDPDDPAFNIGGALNPALIAAELGLVVADITIVNSGAGSPTEGFVINDQKLNGATTTPATGNKFFLLDLNNDNIIRKDGSVNTGDKVFIADRQGGLFPTAPLSDIANTALQLQGPLSTNAQTSGMQFKTHGFGTDKASGITVFSNVNLDDIKAVTTFIATHDQITGADKSITIPVDQFVQSVGLFKAAGGTFKNFTDSSFVPFAGTTTSLTVEVPKYNLINLDLVELTTQPDVLTSATFSNIAVMINATDPGTTPGFVKRSVTQIVNFPTDLNTVTPNSIATLLGTAKQGIGVFNAAKFLNFDWGGPSRSSAFGLNGALDGNTTNLAELKNIKLSFSIVFLANDPTTGQQEPAEVITGTTLPGGDTQVAVVDIGGITAVVPPPLQNGAKFKDDITLVADESFVYRTDLKEQGPNSSIFAGHMDFFTANQLDTTKIILQQILILGDPVKAWLPNRFIPPNRLAFTYTDQDVSGNQRPVSATYIYETRDGSVAWDKSSYSFGQEAFLTVTDPDLNRRPDAQERFFIVSGAFTGPTSIMNYQLGKKRVADQASIASATVTIVPGEPINLNDNPCGTTATSPLLVKTATTTRGEICFAEQADASLLETGPNTGVFVGEFKVPRNILVEDTTAAGGLVLTKVQQQDLQANYEDVRDSSSVTQKFQSITNVRTNTGDLVLDRAAYPPAGIMYIEIHDNDFNTFVDVREQIDLRTLIVGKGDFVNSTDTASQTTTCVTGTPTSALVTTTKLFSACEGTVIQGLNLAQARTAAGFDGVHTATLASLASVSTNVKPLIEINVFQSSTQTGGGGKLLTLLPVGLLDVSQTAAVTSTVKTFTDRFGTQGVFPILDRSGNPITTAVETGPNTGIFEFEVRLPGVPAITQANSAITISGIPSLLNNAGLGITANQPIQVTYFDSSDSSGKSQDIEQLATYLLNTARLRTDKLEYGIGQPVDIVIEEPDFNIDSRAIDNVPFGIMDIITDKLDTEVGTGDFGTVVTDPANQLRTNLTTFRETGFNTGVFAVQLEELKQTIVTRGTDVKLIYIDKTPSGGVTATGGLVAPPIRVEYTFHVASILPEIVFDKEEYTPFDRVFASIVSPDSNQDPTRIDVISPLVSSSSDSLGAKTFPETGPNTGIFEQDFRLTPDKSRFPGELTSHREDGVTIEFRIDKNVVATKSVFVNYHVGQVMFDKDAYRIPERAVLRVIDPDQNTHPDTIDTLQVRLWSTTDRGGLLITLRETGDRTGIFEEILSFTPNEESSGTRLRVSEGDTITAKYTDNTLPAPAALDTAQVFTVEIEELFASALIGQTVPPLERAVASVPDLVDQTGAKLTEAKVGSQVLIQSEITNNQTKAQPFAYIVQVKDKDGVTISLSWVSGSLPSQESLKAAQSWIPDAAGDYTIEVFVWESVDKPTALSPERTTTVTVTA